MHESHTAATMQTIAVSGWIGYYMVGHNCPNGFAVVVNSGPIRYLCLVEQDVCPKAEGAARQGEQALQGTARTSPSRTAIRPCLTCPQMQYELKQYKKGIKAADTILKKFPNHGGTFIPAHMF